MATPCFARHASLKIKIKTWLRGVSVKKITLVAFATQAKATRIATLATIALVNVVVNVTVAIKTIAGKPANLQRNRKRPTST